VTKAMSRNTEEVDTISVAVAGIDINNVEPLDHRRLVAFMNQFLTTTVSFLNHFSAACEDRIEKIHYKICRIEAQLSILESKLNSCSTSVANSDNNNDNSN
jgi:WASH complex subunit CCDC53